MQQPLHQQYIEASIEFRSSKGSHESTAKLYDLLYAIQVMQRSVKEEQLLANIYSLLGYHKSAYETYRPLADPGDRKAVKKLYVLEGKAKSHGDRFSFKDIRKLRGKKEQPNLSVTDFIADEKEENKLTTCKSIVIFNKEVAPDRFEIHNYNTKPVKEQLPRIIEYLHWLCDARQELITYYNTHMAPHTRVKADADWYDTLDIYKARISIGQNGNLFADISGGDVLSSDHILDIETDDRKITHMRYDG